MMMKTRALENRLRAALQPMEPRAAFVTRLRAQLASSAETRRRPSGWVLVLAGVGGALSVASMVFLGRRFGRWLIGMAAPRAARSA
jgi:hypothetical protein